VGAFPTGRPHIARCERDITAAFVEKHELTRIQGLCVGLPRSPCIRVLLTGPQRLFFRGRFARCKARHMVA
jgi:hypothetical protein